MALRFGLIGNGYWANAVHAPGLARHPDVELIGVWGRDAAKSETLARMHGTVAVTDLDLLLDSVDAVAFAVAPGVQGELAVRAAAAGCHLLLEKPVALTTEAAEKLVAAADAADVRSVVFFPGRFAPTPAGWFRDTVSSHTWHGANVTLLASVLTSDSPFADSVWRREKGALWDIGPHALALLLPALGPVRNVVTARGHGDTVQLAYEHTGGGVSAVTLSLTVPEPVSAWRFVLWGEHGLIEIPARAGDELPLAYARAVTELLESISTGRRHELDVRFGAEVVSGLAAAEARLAGS